ncbi:MAG: hypothetical protein WC975_10925 [Phycisphaerae bacterium]
MSKIMTLWIVEDKRTDRAEYLVEILALWGGAFGKIVESVALKSVPSPSVVLVPPGVEVESDLLKTYVERGGHLILIAPTRETLMALNMDSGVQYADDGRVGCLRMAQPLLEGFSHYSLPVVGRRAQPTEESLEIPLPEKARILAHLYEMDRHLNDRPAIWTIPVESGRVTVFAYDLVECYRNLRQGMARYAGWRSNMDLHCRPCDLFGPEWESNYQAGHLPLADFHAMLLLRLVEQSFDVPLPRFWQLPGKSQSAIILSGDEDNADPAYNEQICSFLDSLGGNMVIYVMMQGTQSRTDHLRALMDRGHHFSVHPYPASPGESFTAPHINILNKLEDCFKEFGKRYQLTMRTVRNHRLFWTGYTDIPKLWERLGVEMDCNYGYNSRVRGFTGFFATPPAALPVSFLDLDFRKINVLQQPCHLGDDTCFHPTARTSRKISPELFETYGESLLTQTLEPLGIPFAVCFHPVNYGQYAGEAERRFLLKAKSRNARLMSDYDWLDFWKMRQSWKLSEISSGDKEVNFTFEGQKPSRQLSVTLPAEIKNRKIHTVTMEGRETATLSISHFGQPRILVPLPDEMTRVTMKIILTEEPKFKPET